MRKRTRMAAALRLPADASWELIEAQARAVAERVAAMPPHRPTHFLVGPGCPLCHEGWPGGPRNVVRSDQPPAGVDCPDCLRHFEELRASRERKWFDAQRMWHLPSGVGGLTLCGMEYDGSAWTATLGRA